VGCRVYFISSLQCLRLTCRVQHMYVCVLALVRCCMSAILQHWRWQTVTQAEVLPVYSRLTHLLTSDHVNDWLVSSCLFCICCFVILLVFDFLLHALSIFFWPHVLSLSLSLFVIKCLCWRKQSQCSSTFHSSVG